MQKNKTLSMLGMARRAGKLSMGHDMAEKSIKAHKAQMVLICSDASKRLVKEFERTLENFKHDIPLIVADITINEIHFAVGYKAGIMTVDDVNFSKKIISLIEQEENANGNE
ncbi:MAG: hypothetical protein HFJ97_01940 [Eubacterium sp.]|mgnify:FL=1|nr:hypothetical protein [Eubacterium sp.]